MARIKSKLMVGAASMALALSLGACGGGEPSIDEPSDGPVAGVASVSHEAKQAPDIIEPGWLEGDNTSDMWWPTDPTNPEALYFTHAANDAGMDVTFVDEEGGEDSVWDLEVVDDHLVTLADAPQDKRQVDITFQDNFTCYDAVSDTVYVRGDRSQAEYDALLVGTAFVEDPNDPEGFMVTFEEDGVSVQRQSGYDPLEGTWQVVSTNVVRCHYATGGSEWDTDYRFKVGADDTIAELDDGSPEPLVRFEG